MLGSRSRSLLPVPVLVSLVGIVFSVWNAWDADSVPCFSAGCTLYQTFTIHGFSLWWAGVVVFGLFFMLAFTGRTVLGRICSGIALALDCILLCLMTLTLPCIACMVEAVLFACTYAAFRNADAAAWRKTMGNNRHPVSGLLATWFLCFVMLLGVVMHDLSSPWAVSMPDEGDISAHIFFSPSCSACRRLVSEMLPAQAAKAAWYPVAENEQDIAIILDIARRLEGTENETLMSALSAAMTAPALSFWNRLSPEVMLLQFRLWRNQVYVIRDGGGILPCMAFHGLPEMLLRSRSSSDTNRSGSRQIPRGPISSNLPAVGDISALFDLGEAGHCGGSSPLPCKEPR